MKRVWAAIAVFLLLPASTLAQAGRPVQPAPAASPSIIMLRLYTNDLARSERFYSAVLGAQFVQNMGGRAHILVLSHGSSPGIILIKAEDKDHRVGSFVVQAASLTETLELAKANGAKLLDERFSGSVSGMGAQSALFTDPDGNLIEVLQLGKPGTGPAAQGPGGR